MVLKDAPSFHICYCTLGDLVKCVKERKHYVYLPAKCEDKTNMVRFGRSYNQSCCSEVCIYANCD